MREPKTIDVLLLILLGAIWGSAFLTSKLLHTLMTQLL